MTRAIFHGGTVVDGTGAPPALADVVIENGRIVAVGPGLDGELSATTSSAAALLGVDEKLGTLEPGKLADLVVVDGDPLDVTTLGARVRGVYQDGRLVSSGRSQDRT